MWGTLRVGVKSCHPERTTCCEGATLERIRRSGTKPRGTNRIRYPGSPRCKRCGLDVGGAPSALSVEAKVISPLPGEYGRKAET